MSPITGSTPFPDGPTDNCEQPSNDPGIHMARVLGQDVARRIVFDRVKQAKLEYLAEFNCEPCWVRVGVSLNRYEDKPLWFGGQTILGLEYRPDFDHPYGIEVGSSKSN